MSIVEVWERVGCELMQGPVEKLQKVVKKLDSNEECLDNEDIKGRV